MWLGRPKKTRFGYLDAQNSTASEDKLRCPCTKHTSQKQVQRYCSRPQEDQRDGQSPAKTWDVDAPAFCCRRNCTSTSVLGFGPCKVGKP